MTRAAHEPESIVTLPTLRLLTCGSVDDGKSTLIGRLLVEQNAVFADQLAAAASDSRKYGTRGAETDLALLVDGLEDERQQGITIDVAYRYFSTPRRSFIIADTPGHEQFTRNMATGASNADLAVLLVDARKGILAQTRRHAAIAALLGVRHLVLAVNKMDLVAFSEATFTAITAAFAAYATSLDIASVVFIPICAVDGDTIARRGDRLPWYSGPTLLEHLETVEIEPTSPTQPFRFPVQWINRGSGEFRGLSGTIAGGAIRLGEAVLVAASGRSSTVARIIAPDGDAIEAKAGDAVTLVLADDVDVSRGDVLCAPKDRPEVAENFAAHLIWMDQAPARTGRSYLMKAATRLVPAAITRIGRIDIETLQDAPAPSLALNDIGVCDLTAGAPFTFDPYAENRKMGAFILIDRETNATAAAGMILRSLRRATNVRPQELALTEADRSLLKRQRPAVLWFTGLSGAGKSTIANLVEARLHALGCHTMLLDGDNLRHGLNKDLGFSEADRSENIRRAGEVAKLMTEAGIVVLCSFISPFAAERDMVRMRFDDNFLEVFVDTSLEECMARDPKGLYRRALAGEIPNFTGIGQAYEPPRAAEIIVGRDRESAEDAAMRVVSLLAARGFIEAA